MGIFDRFRGRREGGETKQEIRDSDLAFKKEIPPPPEGMNSDEWAAELFEIEYGLRLHDRVAFTIPGIGSYEGEIIYIAMTSSRGHEQKMAYTPELTITYVVKGKKMSMPVQFAHIRELDLHKIS